MKTTPLILISLSLAGCATIVKSSRQNLYIASDPPGAIASSADADCITPCSLRMDRAHPHFVKVQKLGFSPLEFPIWKEQNGWVWFNLFSWFIPGMVVDSATGATYDLKPDAIFAQLKRNDEIQDRVSGK